MAGVGDHQPNSHGRGTGGSSKEFPFNNPGGGLGSGIIMEFNQSDISKIGGSHELTDLLYDYEQVSSRIDAFNLLQNSQNSLNVEQLIEFAELTLNYIHDTVELSRIIRILSDTYHIKII
jgi:hypothetical protein